MKELFLTLMLVVVLAIAGGPSVLAETPQQIDSAVAHTMINPRNGNTVRFNGTLHHVVRKRSAPAADQIILGSDAQDVSGLDAKGIQYRLARANDFTVPNPAGKRQVTVTEDVPVLNQGAGSDFLLHLTLQVAMNADGKMVTTINKLHGDCQTATPTPASRALPADETG